MVVFLCVPSGKGAYLTSYTHYPLLGELPLINGPVFFLPVAWEVIYDFKQHNNTLFTAAWIRVKTKLLAFYNLLYKRRELEEKALVTS